MRKNINSRSVSIMASSITSGLALGMFFLSATASTADIITRTYELASYSADQDGATLSGSITIEFDSTAGSPGGVVALGGADYALLDVSDPITTWNFMVSKPGQQSYQVSSSDPYADNYSISLNLYSTPTTLSVAPGASLTLGINTGVSTEQTEVSWQRASGPGLYISNVQGNTSPRGWLTLGPQNIDLDSRSGWIIGTAIPEPGTATLLILGAGMTVLGIRRIRNNDADSDIE